MTARKPPCNYLPRILLVAIFPLLLNACATTPGKSGAQAQAAASAPSKMYQEGKEALSAENYDLAIEKFSSLEALYPDDPYTQQAQMELAYAYHKNGDATSAIATADRFIKDNPAHPNVDYAYYLRGLTSFEQAIEQLAPVATESIQRTQRRPLMAQLSLQYLSELVDKFPDSKYSSDASRRIVFLKDKLAQYEVLLAQHYLDNGDYANAALHAKSAIENYPQAPAIPEAATITNQAYKLLGIENADVGDMAASRAGDKSTTTAMNEKTSDSSNVAPPKAPVVIPFNAKETRPQGTPAKEQKTASAMESPPAEETAAENIQKTPQTQPTTTDNIQVQQQDGIRREAWLLAQEPNDYTIQLLGTGNERLLVAMIKR
jgi:outer membrane protein assembly factor BamD